MKPIAVFVVPASPDGKILVVKHRQDAYDRDLGEHTWGLPGGGIDEVDNESPILAAIREVREETGLYAYRLEHVSDFIQRKPIKNQPGKFDLSGLRLLRCEPSDIESAVGFTSPETEEVRLICPGELKLMLDVFLLAHLRMILTFLNSIHDPRLVPHNSRLVSEVPTPLSRPVECPSLGIRDRELLSVLRL